MFKRKKMNEKDLELDDISEGKIPVFDKRRYSHPDSTPAEKSEPAPPVKPLAEAALEEKLKAEVERREAAEAKLVGVQAKFDEAKAGLERETAEMRSRLMKTLEDRAKQAQFDFLTTLLPVLDNLNRAVVASETDPSIDHLRAGVIGTVRSFERALIDVGVEPIASVGAAFDPEVHQAIDTIEVGAESDGHVTAEYSRGYRFGTQLLRPATVQVGKAKAHTAAE